MTAMEAEGAQITGERARVFFPRAE